MKSFTSKELARITGGTLYGSDTITADLVLIDSRRLSEAHRTVFFAIRGERNDGHDYVGELYRNGVRCFVGEEVSGELDDEVYAFVLVDNSIDALQKFARYVRAAYDGEVLAITGSNGKTIIKEWLYQVLNSKIPMVRSPLSYNSQVGVPLTLFLLEDRYKLSVVEAGISKPGEMQRLEKMIRPDTGIFSNIGLAHQENFTSQKEKVSEKMKLFQGCRRLIYCRDHEKIHEQAIQLPAGVEKVSWSTKKVADYMVSRKIAGGKTMVSVEGQGHGQFSIPFTDAASFENAVHIFVYLHAAGYPVEYIARQMAKLEPVAMRMEVFSAVNQCTVINDAYNSDLVSLSNAIDFLNQQKQHPKKTLILSDILQSGKPDHELYREVSRMINGKGVDRLIGIGQRISSHSELFPKGSVFFDSTADFLDNFQPSRFRNEAILLKGSRPFRFELISRVLQEKAHRTVMEIDLNALVENFRYYKSLVKKDTKIMAMVKAFSYGSGGYEVASVLQYHHVDYLAVAYADEGVTLRKNGICIPVMVMNPEKNDFFLLTEYNLEPELYNFRVLHGFREYLERNGLRNYPVHLKIDTGMHRLGFEEQDTDRLIRSLAGDTLRVVSVFSHLAAADEPENDDFTRLQIAMFKALSDRISAGTGKTFLRHILNSAGTERFPDAAFDMVRLGIGLYGVSSFRQDKLREVSTFRTSIAQIRDIEPGDTVGYGLNGRSRKRRQIATIPVGYADGVLRSLGNRQGAFLIRGKLAPITGNICMDMTMVDVTGLGAEEGDEVIIFGNRLPVSKVAEKAGTIPYEMLTGISERVKRIYLHD